MSEVINGLGSNGKLMVVGATFDPIEVTPTQRITGSKSIQGWASGTPTKAAEAYARMMNGNAQFRVVLTM